LIGPRDIEIFLRNIFANLGFDRLAAQNHLAAGKLKTMIVVDVTDPQAGVLPLRGSPAIEPPFAAMEKVVGLVLSQADDRSEYVRVKPRIGSK
jgi:hypothetical protein